MEENKNYKNAQMALSAASAALVIALLLCLFLSGFKSTSIPLSIGERYLEQMNYEKAVWVFEGIIEVEPACKDAYKNLYTAYIALGEEEKAVAILEKGWENTQDEELHRLLEETKKPKADFEKVDAWLMNEWEEKGNIAAIRHPSTIDGVYYSTKFDSACQRAWQVLVPGNQRGGLDMTIEKFNPYTGEKSIVYEGDCDNGFCFCVVDNKIYFASDLQYQENDTDDGFTVTKPAKIWFFDLETKEKTLLCDEIYMEIDRIMPLKDGIFLSGLKMEDTHEFFDYLGSRDWNMVISYDGKIITPMQEKIWSGYTNALILGEHLVSDGENTYAGLSKINSRLETEWKADANDYEETVALTDNKLFYTDSTGTQCDVNPIEYLKYVDLSTGEVCSTGLDAHYRGLTLLEIPCVLNSMTYAVYTNIPIVDDGDSDWDDYMMCDIYEREAAEKQGFTEEKGYFYYFYRYDLENGVYIPLNEAAAELEKDFHS